MFPFLNKSEEEISNYIVNVNSSMVENTLQKSAHKRNYGDLLNLISPVAGNYLREMHKICEQYRKMHFGKTVRIYSPLYVTNKCVNRCKYCDFNHDNPSVRKELSLDEIVEECKAIKATGIDSLLLVAGEDPVNMSAKHLAKIVERIHDMFSYISIEVAPMSEEDYKLLHEAGIEGVTLYQETYNQDLYSHLHPSGPKRHYMNRIGTHERAGKAGIRTLGMGFLLGLYDWRIEAASLAAHAMYIQKNCWRSKVQLSFPRITPISGGFQAPAVVDEVELEQLMLAFRIVFPEVDMTISTRECASFRDKMVKSCVPNMSAGSRVTPGGYALLADEDVGQFTLNDQRSVQEIESALRNNNLEVVTKFWDRVM